jgi:hypothetical protein
MRLGCWRRRRIVLSRFGLRTDGGKPMYFDIHFTAQGIKPLTSYGKQFLKSNSDYHATELYWMALQRDLNVSFETEALREQITNPENYQTEA